MSRRGINRTILFVVGLLVTMSLSSASAFAAGKPIVTSGVTEGVTGLTTFTVGGTVNPNGAETTYKVEYGTTESLGTIALEGNAGSGTEALSKKRTFDGSPPRTRYYYRMSATNKYGTSASSISFTETYFWSAWGPKPWAEFPSSYNSYGTVKIEFPGFKQTVNCDSNGAGTIGNASGVGDNYTFIFSECVLYYKSEEWCKLPDSTQMKLDGNLKAAEPKLMYLEFTDECHFGGGNNVEVAPGDGFYAQMVGIGKVALPLTLSEEAYFGAQKVIITDSSTWTLGGANYGKKFGIG